MLYLLPNALDPTLISKEHFSPAVAEAVACLDGLIAESDRAGRRYLDQFGRPRTTPIAITRDDANFLVEPMKKGETWGLISDGGLPCLADPGSQIVAAARYHKVPIKAIPGPCSITLALMLSGIQSQSFHFHGYPPREHFPRYVPNCTHIFIQTPYKNVHFYEFLLDNLPDKALLSIACDLTLATEMVMTHAVSTWKNKPTPDIHKRPTMFLFKMSTDR